MARTRVFEATREFEDSITELLDLLYPIVAGLWGLRIELAGYLDQIPMAKEADLQARFLTGSGIGGSGLRPLMRYTWSAQQEAIGSIALLSVIALYEGWAAQCTNGLTTNTRQKAAKALQWPPKRLNPNGPNGVDAAINLFTGAPPTHAAAMRAIGSATSKDRVIGISQLGPSLVAYRAMKERRNAIAHTSGRATPLTVRWDQAASRYTATDLGLRHSLRLGNLAVGDRVTVDVQQVSSFIRLLLQLAATVDAAVAVSSAAEAEVIRRYQSAVSGPAPMGTKRERHVENVLRTHGIPVPIARGEVLRMLEAYGVVS